MSDSITLAPNSNQALGIGQYAIDFLNGGGKPGPTVLERTNLFHVDAVLCGASALALETNSPTLLRNEALQYRCEVPSQSAFVFGSTQQVWAEKAILANCAAVREWDSNGTNFGYRPKLHHTAGEFGHNDFYSVCIAACQQAERDGETALRAMVLLDEIRGRLAEVFSLKSYKIDHVVHGAIASAAVYGAIIGANAEQIESAIGMFVAHYIPWRAIRAGKQLSDSKGASAAISTEAAILCMKRSIQGFLGPRDVFRNPEAIFRFFEPTTHDAQRWSEVGDSPFELVLSTEGSDFAVMGMHFKLGLYEHQSAGALQGVINLVAQNPTLVENAGDNIGKILIRAYEPAFGIIGNPAKLDPKTRQSADHSMAYIVATLLRKAIEASAEGLAIDNTESKDGLWKQLILTPYDYSAEAIFHPLTRELMNLITFEHGGPSFDAKYPEGIPTSVEITSNAGVFESGLIMYPAGHARNSDANLTDILDAKFSLLGALALPDGADVQAFVAKLKGLACMDAHELGTIYDFDLAHRPGYE